MSTAPGSRFRPGCPLGDDPAYQALVAMLEVVAKHAQGDQSGLAAHLTARDAQLLREEDACRARFVSNPAAMVAAWQRGELLLDVFDPACLASWVVQADPSPYPLLFSQHHHPTWDHPAGSSAVVSSLAAFKASFAHITGRIFEGVDWDNMVVAGGAVTACLLRPPDDVAAADITTLPGRDKWTQWLGPNTLKADQPELAGSGSGDSDIDIFLYGLSPQAATDKLNTLLAQLDRNKAADNGCSMMVVSPRAVTLVVDAARSSGSIVPAVHVQVVLRLFSCPAEVLMNFDADSCCTAFDGNRVFALPRARRAFTQCQNLADPQHHSSRYEKRLAKYARRGFRVAVPGFPGMRGVDASIFYTEVADLKGLAALLRREQLGACRQGPDMDQEVKYIVRDSTTHSHTFHRRLAAGKALSAVWVHPVNQAAHAGGGHSAAAGVSGSPVAARVRGVRDVTMLDASSGDEASVTSPQWPGTPGRSGGGDAAGCSGGGLRLGPDRQCCCTAEDLMGGMNLDENYAEERAAAGGAAAAAAAAGAAAAAAAAPVAGDRPGSRKRQRTVPAAAQQAPAGAGAAADAYGEGEEASGAGAPDCEVAVFSPHRRLGGTWGTAPFHDRMEYEAWLGHACK